MTAFYFDVGGVLIPDKFSPSHAFNVFRELAERYHFDPAPAYAAYTRLQPCLDLGSVSLTYLCDAIGIQQQLFERDWLAMHPVNPKAISIIERLRMRGHSVGLATNFCRHLLDLLIATAPVLSQLVVCCSSDIGLAKPSAEFFERASRLINSQDVVFVDDRALNVNAARRFGWTAIQAGDGWFEGFERSYLANSHA